ncbi:RraA family protein [Lysobacter korlensis]|uniref:Putative 4-hydroxy-4-methyl-2-oxoglutarate aldolase n=1 Tax=Lysobacter korlensis TaxID=553636 RepID=A0ABV6RMR8_9GAMM
MEHSPNQPPTAAVADAALRLRVPVRLAPVTLLPVTSGAAFSGMAQPVTHLGSVDVFLDAIDDAAPGSVLVIDNGGRDDEACVGDLVVLEAKLAGLAGLVVWGRHRDTAQLRQIGLPVYSRGACPLGPLRVPPAGRPMRSAVLDGVPVTAEDLVVADDDGVLFVGPERRDEILKLAAGILQTESRQADRMAAGASLREQLDFAGYRRRQAQDPQLTLRQHLLELGSAIEV